jgi:ParB/RepB/Spo0J family partition protein
MKRNIASKDAIQTAFDYMLIELSLDQIVQTRLVGEAIRNSAKFKQINSSIKEVGIIEPIVVGKQNDSKGKYYLLDGHLRLAVSEELGSAHITCIISSDDEAFTYNRHVNRISPIQEHRMILRAVARGVPSEKIASALNLDVKSITKKRNLLKGICPDVSEKLKDKLVGVGVFAILRKMKDFRQIEAVTLMDALGDYTVAYARILLGGTPPHQLLKPKKNTNLPTDVLNRMETELKQVQRDYELIEENYGADVLNHRFAKGYITSLLDNVRIVRHLAQNHAETLSEFQSITQAT